MQSMLKMKLAGILLAIIMIEAHENLSRFEMPESQEEAYPLENLGNSIAHRLSTLSCPFGMLLYKDLQRYYNQLSDVYRLLKKRDVVDIVKGFKVYSRLERAGGPTHLNVTLNVPALKKKYSWSNDGEIASMKEVLMLTKELWEDMQDRAAHLRSGKPEPVPVEESTIDWTPFLREVSSGSEVSHY